MNPEYRLLTKRTILVFFSFFNLYAGYMVGSRLMICFGFTLLFLLVFTWHAAHNFFRDIKAERLHYPRVFEEEQIRVRIRIEPGTPIPLYMLELTDTFPAGDSYWIHSLLPEPIDSRSTVEVEYRTECTRHRGVYVLGPLKMTCSDPLGIHRRRIELPVITDLLLYPTAPDLEYFELLEDGTLSQVGMETLLRPGHSEEFTGLREFDYGDNPRHIHWPSSVRNQKLLVKEFREDITTEVTLFLDMRRLSLSGVGDITSVEYIVKAAAAVARAAVDKSHMVQFFALGGNKEHVPLGGGYQHLITILDRLTYLRPKGESAFEHDLALHIPELKRGSTAVLIASATSIHPEKLSPLVRRMRDRNILTTVVLIDDRSFIKMWREQDFRWKKALPIRQLQEILRREGCSLFMAAKGDDVAEKLQAPLK